MTAVLQVLEQVAGTKMARASDHCRPEYCAASDARATSRVLLRATGLTKSFGGRQVLDGIDLELRQGEVVLLRGDNGSGKTTLLNILSGNLAPGSGIIHLSANGSEETFRFPRRWWQNLNPADHFLPERVAREGVGRSWQETRLFPTLRLVDNVAVAEPHHPGENPFNVLFRPGRVRQAEKDAESEAARLLDALGLNGRAQSSADMISLGQTKRVAIARAVSAGGRTLFLDEPLAGLDDAGVEAVLGLLRPLASEHRVTLVIIEHVWNVHHILGFATTVWTLRDGQLAVEPLDSGNGATLRTEQTGALKRLRELTEGLHLVGSTNLPRGASLSVYRHPNRPETGDPLLEVSGLMVRRGRRPVIGENGETAAATNGLDLTLRDGDLAILQAPNGWGKTTLFEAIAGLLPLTGGTVRILRHDVTRAPAWVRAHAGLHLLRTDNRTFPSLTVDETFALSDAGAAPNALAALRNRQTAQLSGGEQQAVALGQLGAADKHVYLLDEPFSALDGQHVDETLRVIRQLAGREQTAVLITLPSVGGTKPSYQNTCTQKEVD